MMISTQQLVSSSEARKKFGQLLEDITTDKKKYFIILDNGKVTAALIHPSWLEELENKDASPVLDVAELRGEWKRHQKEVADALTHLEKQPENSLPTLLQ